MQLQQAHSCSCRMIRYCLYTPKPPLIWLWHICQTRNVFIENQDAHETKRIFQRKFANWNTPSVRTIRHNHHINLIHGTSTNRNKGNSGRHHSAWAPQNIAATWRDIQRNPSVSARKMILSQKNFKIITRNDLNFHPYRVHMQHALEAGDPLRWIAFCQWLLSGPPRFVLHMSIVDEAAFFMNGKVNTWSMHEYAPKINTKLLNYMPNDRRAVMVWVGLIHNNTIIGPYFYSQTVHQHSCRCMINQYVVPQLAAKYGQGSNGCMRRWWLVQDGAPAHRAAIVRQRLQQLFPNCAVGLGHQTEWSLRSLDLTPCGFSLWDYLTILSIKQYHHIFMHYNTESHMKYKHWDAPECHDLPFAQWMAEPDSALLSMGSKWAEHSASSLVCW